MDPRFAAAIRDVTYRLRATAHAAEVKSPLSAANAGQISKHGRSAIVAFEIPGDDDVAKERVDASLATVGKTAGTTANLTGMTAGSRDLNDTIKSQLPLVFGFVLGRTFLLLLVTFRSLIIPIKAIVLNLLWVGASYGILKLVFRDGHGEKLLGFHSIGGITSWLEFKQMGVGLSARSSSTRRSCVRSCRPRR